MKIKLLSGIVLMGVCAWGNTTWYRNCNMNTQSPNWLKDLQYWNEGSETGSAGSGTVSATDDLVLTGSFAGSSPTRMRIPCQTCACNSLTIGSATSDNEVVLDMYVSNGNVWEVPHDGLRLVNGNLFFNGGGNYEVRARMEILSTTDATAFRFRYGQGQYSNRTARITGALVGTAQAKARFGRMTAATTAHAAQNSTFRFSNIDDYAGTLTVVEGYDGKVRRLNGANFGTRLMLPVGSASTCRVDVQAGAVLKAGATSGTVQVGSVNFAAGSRLEVANSEYAAAVIRATESVTVAPGTEVALVESSLLLGGTSRVPVLVAPSTATFTVDDFSLVTYRNGTASTVVMEVEADEAAGTRTLYLKSDGTRGTVWFSKSTPLASNVSALSNLDQWKDVDGNIGPAGAPTATDELVIRGNSRVRSLSVTCPAKSLQLGDSTGYGEIVQDNKNITILNEGLRLFKGWWWFNNGPGYNFTLNGAVTILPNTGNPPAMFFGQAGHSNSVAAVTGPMQGAADARLDIGKCDEMVSPTSSVRNGVYEFYDLADYQGLIRVRADVVWTYPDHGGCVRVRSRTGTSTCQVRLQNGCYISTVETNGVTTIGALTFEAGSGIRVHGCATGVGGIAVSQSLTVVDPSRKIPVVWENFVYGGAAQTKWPVFSWPSGTALTLDNFELVKSAGSVNTVTLSVENNTLYVQSDSRVRQIASLKVDRDVNWNSSFTNAASWSDGLLPHTGSAYYTTRTLCSGGLYADYVFPGDSLELDGATLWLSTRTLTVPQMTCRGGARLFTTSIGGDKTFALVAEAFAFSDKVTLQAHRGNTLLLQGPITGSGEIYMPSHSGTGSPEASYELRGDNSGYTGRIKLNQEERRTHYVDASGTRCFYDMAYHFPTLYVGDGRNLGGAMAELDRRALTLTGLGRLAVTNAVTVTLADGLNRGVYIDDVGRFYTKKGATLDVQQPILLGGHMWKEGPGTLILAGETKFEATSGGTIIDEPVAESNRFTVAEGVVKIANMEALQGVATTISNGALQVVYSPDSVDFLKYGIRNTLIDNPFALEAICGGKLPISVDAGEAPEPTGRETAIGLVTVNAAAATTVRAMLAGYAVPRAWPNLPNKVREIANDDDTVTFALICRHSGTSILLR